MCERSLFLYQCTVILYFTVVLGCPRFSRSVSRAFIFLSLRPFLYFSDSFVAGASKTQELFSQVFIIKIRVFRRENKDKNL